MGKCNCVCATDFVNSQWELCRVSGQLSCWMLLPTCLFPAKSFYEVQEEILNNPYFRSRQGIACVCNFGHPINFLCKRSHCIPSISMNHALERLQRAVAPFIEFNWKNTVAWSRVIYRVIWLRQRWCNLLQEFLEEFPSQIFILPVLAPETLLLCSPCILQIPMNL